MRTLRIFDVHCVGNWKVEDNKSIAERMKVRVIEYSTEGAEKAAKMYLKEAQGIEVYSAEASVIVDVIAGVVLV